MAKLKGYFKKPDNTPNPDKKFAESMLGSSSLLEELRTLKTDITEVVDVELKKIDDKIQEVDSKIEDFGNTAKSLIEDIKQIPQIQGLPGKDADQETMNKVSSQIKGIEENILLKVPKVDEEALTSSILSRVPKYPDVNALTQKIQSRLKPSLKILQERTVVDPMAIIDKILKLPEGKFKLKTSHIDGLDQTIRAFQSQIGKSGYLHGGGTTVVAGTGITLVNNPNGTTTINTSGIVAGLITTSGLTMSTNRLLGRTTAGTGAIEEITVGAGLNFAAGTLSAVASAPTLAAVSAASLTTPNSLYTMTAGIPVEFRATSTNPVLLLDETTEQASVQALNIIGTAGAGFISLIDQGTNPTPPPAGTVLLHAFTKDGFTRVEQDNEAPTNLTYGRDNAFTVINQTGSTIVRGSLVHLESGFGFTTPSVVLAKAADLVTAPAMAIILDDIADGAFGQAMYSGIIQNIDGQGFTPGTPLYLDPSVAGGIINTRPVFPFFAQPIGAVISGDATQGAFKINISPFVGGQESGTNAAIFRGQAGIFGAASSLTLGTSTGASGAILWKNATNSNTITIQSGVTSADYTLTLPLAQGGASTFLQNNGSGVLSWAAAGTGTVTAIGVTTANGVSGTSSGGATPNLTITLGAITPSTIVATSTISATTGFKIGGAAASRKMLVGDGTNFVPSTETWAVPGTVGNVLVSDGTNWTSSAVSIGSTITVANEATDTTNFIGFFTASTGSLQPKTNANLTYNSSTGNFGAAPFIKFDTGQASVQLGYQAGLNTTLGTLDNTYVGNNAGTGVTPTGAGASGNTIVGSNALLSFDSGSGNSALGANALRVLVNGSVNTAIGSSALAGLTGGGFNTAVGAVALRNNVSGSGNVAIGESAGRYETGSNSFYIDNQDRTNTAGDKAKALIYGQFNATALSQQISFNVGYFKSLINTVAGLVAAATAGAGARSIVSDALTPVFGAAVVGGGAVTVPVYSDGTNWLVG